MPRLSTVIRPGKSTSGRWIPALGIVLVLLQLLLLLIAGQAIAGEQKAFAEPGSGPGDPASALRMGNLAYRGKNYPSALGYYSMFPQNIDCRLGIGLALHKMKKHQLARPHLLAAFAVYPANAELLAALKDINEKEIAFLEKRISKGSVSEKVSVEQQLRLETLYELNGHFLKAANMLRGWLPPRPGFNDMIRVADLLAAASSWAEAGKFYELASSQSPKPRLTNLAAVDCYISSKNLARAEVLLNWLLKQAPGIDLDLRYAALLTKKGDSAGANKIYKNLGAKYEAYSQNETNPKETLLLSVDAYLNGKYHSDAQRVLNRVGAQSRDYSVDLRLARYFFDTGNFLDAVAIYEQYPESTEMQISRGWALARLDHRKEAKRAFQAVEQKFPGHAAAKAGLFSVDNSWHWNLFLLETQMNYGDYQDKRLLSTQALKYIAQRAVSTVSHTNSNIPSLSAGNIDFNEDLLGLRFYYLFRPRYAGQLHLLHFENDDPNTDHSDVFGGRFFYFPNQYWSIDAEIDRSDYKTADADQFNLHAGYRFHRKWLADLTTVFVRVSGPWRGSRTGIQPSSAGVKAAIGFVPNGQWTFGISVWGGDRLLAVDSDGLFAYNIIDRYQAAWAFQSSYRFKPWTMAYLSLGASNFVSDLKVAANKKAGFAVYDPDQSVSSLTGGMDFSF